MGLREEQLDFLARVMAETKLSRHALAIRSDILPPTLTMFVNSKKGAVLKAETIRKIEIATGIRFGAEALRRVDLRQSESEPFKGVLPVAGTDATTLWGRANGVDPWTLRSRALECAGYMPGDILVVDLNAEPKPGDVVCAQLYDWSGGKADTIFRLWEPPYLQPATLDSSLRKIIPVDNDKTFISGVVIASFRGRQARAA